jgi:hypothetical protein
VREPYGVERITRHPFFAGMALFATAHALLATRLVGTVFAAALGLLAVAGARHQDRKLLARHGAPYGEYLAETSAIPFAAVLAGRQRLVWRELPLGAAAAGVLAALALRAIHPSIFAQGGAWVIGAALLGAALAASQSWRRARRAAAHGTVAAMGPRSPSLAAGDASATASARGAGAAAR